MINQNESLQLFMDQKVRGGGTGPMNVRDTYMGDDGVDDYYKYFNPAEMADGSGLIDWTQVIANNQQWSSGSEFDTTYSDKCTARNESLEHL